MPCAYVGGARALPGSTCHGLTPWYGSATDGVSRDTSVQVSCCFKALGAGTGRCRHGSYEVADPFADGPEAGFAPFFRKPMSS